MIRLVTDAGASGHDFGALMAELVREGELNLLDAGAVDEVKVGLEVNVSMCMCVCTRLGAFYTHDRLLITTNPHTYMCICVCVHNRWWRPCWRTRSWGGAQRGWRYVVICRWHYRWMDR